ncbi:GNAT family N-acetyltransferase [Paenibacillus typhae]|uniref:Protein N-acetyltransferase, RimJ/RimL family n=1 Tax=Paenibacillus typhae TaxID=1174501 RepID=A0A1G9FTN7_9BACL|nr:GNAT family N-acetyltransferase [Paenibacillus typhae]SDK91702.1 Protein N-acetyltransferase, RimJ/RimL family [Paenibacillus typhae]
MISENIRPLNGTFIQMVPMEAAHRAELTAILSNPLIWEFTWRKITSAAQVEQLMDTALSNKEKGHDLPFVMLDRSTGRIAGTSRIMHIDQTHRNAEIGCTWIAPEYWRTPVNTEGKALLLQHCFEELGLIRVNFTIVSGNLRSQRAIERIGATKEGLLRKHRITSEGTAVDNVLYSIIDEEWPGVKANLHYLLQEKYN